MLAEDYHVSRPTIHKIPARGRKRDFSIHNSCNARFRTLAWGMKRLAKIEKKSDTKDQWQDGTSPTDLDGDVDKEHFEPPEHRRKSPAHFANDYNWVKSHKSPGNLTPGEKLCLYFFSQDFVNNP